MRRFTSTVILILLTAAVGAGQTPDSLSVARNRWTVTADSGSAVLSLSHQTLGVVIQNARLYRRTDSGLKPLAGWSVRKESESRLTIRTAQPPSVWQVDLLADLVKISSTTADAVLTAEAPAPRDRMVARALDREGVPVTWVGTNPIVNQWHGRPTERPSFLPRRNPEVMYFALGQVSSANLHALFDRGSDTLISFSDQTTMRRNRADVLDLTMPVPGNVVIRLLPDYYVKTLGAPFYVPFDDSRFPSAPMSWGSWTTCYAEVTEQDIVSATDWLASHLKPYGFQYIMLDDGYDKAKVGEPHTWFDWNREKFPHGPKWLADYVKSKGLHPGLWLVPNSWIGAVEQHPDWYLRNNQGKFILNYDTPVLDHTHPEVLAFLRKLFGTLRGWGFDYFKLDGEFSLPAYAPDVDVSKVHDASVSAVEAYRNRMKVIRETVGPETLLEGAPEGTPLDGIGYFTTYWNGYDAGNSWPGMHSAFSSINAHAFLNHVLVYLMPAEGIEVAPRMSVAEAARNRKPSFLGSVQELGYGRDLGTTPAEARTITTFMSLSGVSYSVASYLPELPEDRVRLLKQTMPTQPIYPIDLFSRGTDLFYGKFLHADPNEYIHNYPEILDLKVNAASGVYDVVGMTNWRTETVTRELAFADKLGLDDGGRYVAFDFWNQKPYGVFKDRLTVRIEPHDTRVLLLHPLLDRPQLIGTSRHISGAYSIQDLAWDAAKNRLSGSSETVPGDPYTLWVHVPDGFHVTGVRAQDSADRSVSPSQELTDGGLRVSFPGQSGAVRWEVEFSGKAAQ